MLNNQANIKAVITADDRASAVLSRFGKGAQTIGGKIEGALKAAAKTTFAAGTAITAFGVLSVKAFSESQDEIAQTNAVLKSTGKVAGVTAGQVTKLATSLQKSTKFSDEQVRSAENLLLTFTSIGKKIFPQATKTVLDMATALGEDTKSASIQLGKALQDPINGITALRRVGVNFTDKQRDLIKSLVETGHKAEAQRIILAELHKEFGGSAEAAGKTFAGKLAILKNTLNDVEESIGGVIVNALMPFAARLSNFISSDKFQDWLKRVNEWIAVNLPKALNWLTNTGIPFLSQAFRDLVPFIKGAWDVLSHLVDFMSKHMSVFWALVTVLGAIKVGFALSGALKAFTAVMTGVEASAAVAKGSLSALVGPWQITVGIIGVAAVIYGIKQIKDALDDLKKKAKAQSSIQVPVPGGGKASSTSGVGIVSGFQRFFRGFASGTDYAPGGMAVVGERGPELVNLPRGASVTPNHKMVPTGGTINININAGAFLGTAVEARKYADIILTHMKDLASAKNMTLQDYIKA